MLFYNWSVLFFWAFFCNHFSTGFTNNNNLFPCMYSNNTEAYNAFLQKHVRSDAPDTLKESQWQDFINQTGTCSRPIQSFIPYAQKQEVDNICSPLGGKTYMNNLCVSKQQFEITSVYVGENCVVTRVILERKYLLLACDEIQNFCRPVHFEVNKNNDGPKNNDPDCKNPKNGNQAQFYTFNLGLLILTLLSATLACFI